MAKPVNNHYLWRPIAIVFILLFLVLAIPLANKAQSKFSKWKNAEDSLVIVQMHQSQWHPYGGIHLSSDAELYYVGASLQAGVDFNPTPRLAFSAYIHYFHASTDNKPDGGISETGRFRTFTSAVLIQLHAGPGWYKGFFLGGGVALQQYADRFRGPIGDYDISRTTVTPAIRTGYIFPAGLHAIAIEFNGTGPYSYSDGYTGIVTEVFTQVSLGARFIF